MEHRNLIGQDTPAQEPVIRVTENRGGRLHHAAIIDDSLKDYSDDNIESIKAAVLSHGGKTDYLNFIDDSNNVIRSTVGYETDNNASPFSLYGKVPVSFTAKASTTQYLTGGKILIGNYAYTLGPALSASKAYSAGHGFSGTVDVKDLMGTKIGSATSHLGSLSGDWSKITPYGGEFFPVVAKATPIAGKQVYMLGATSGETVGKITRNIAVLACLLGSALQSRHKVYNIISTF